MPRLELRRRSLPRVLRLLRQGFAGAPSMPTGCTGRTLEMVKPMVLLIGSYLPDQWQSMLRFGQMMLDGLRGCGVAARLIHPPAVFGRIRVFGVTAAKWLGYIDKFVLFRCRL